MIEIVLQLNRGTVEAFFSLLPRALPLPRFFSMIEIGEHPRPLSGLRNDEEAKEVGRGIFFGLGRGSMLS
jgi:hypothetical protein